MFEDAHRNHYRQRGKNGVETSVNASSMVQISRHETDDGGDDEPPAQELWQVARSPQPLPVIKQVKTD